MYLYVPDKLPENPALIVAVHACHGTALDFFNGTTYASLAQKYGYVVVYPNSPNSFDQCWDVGSNATLTHLGGGDSFGIHSMALYAIKRFHVDTSRVFVTGVSSGAMMTQVLLGTYPDIFRAGSAFAGVPFACFAEPNSPPDTWSDPCADGNVTHTPQEWGNIVRRAFPTFQGERPKVQITHGTIDETLNYQNFWEEMKQWSNVLGLPLEPETNVTNFPEPTWWTATWAGGRLQATSETGEPHNLINLENEALRFFGFRDETVP